MKLRLELKAQLVSGGSNADSSWVFVEISESGRGARRPRAGARARAPGPPDSAVPIARPGRRTGR